MSDVNDFTYKMQFGNTPYLLADIYGHLVSVFCTMLIDFAESAMLCALFMYAITAEDSLYGNMTFIQARHWSVDI